MEISRNPPRMQCARERSRDAGPVSARLRVGSLPRAPRRVTYESVRPISWAQGQLGSRSAEGLQ